MKPKLHSGSCLHYLTSIILFTPHNSLVDSCDELAQSHPTGRFQSQRTNEKDIKPRFLSYLFSPSNYSFSKKKKS